jgi:hypothetical protein
MTTTYIAARAVLASPPSRTRALTTTRSVNAWVMKKRHGLDPLEEDLVGAVAGDDEEEKDAACDVERILRPIGPDERGPNEEKGRNGDAEGEQPAEERALVGKADPSTGLR